MTLSIPVSVSSAEQPKSAIGSSDSPASDVPDLVALTGFRRGDRIELESTSRDSESKADESPPPLPEWSPVASSDGVILGYAYNDPKFDLLTAEEIERAGHPELTIFDEHGRVIGHFVNGEPVLDSEVVP